MVTKDSLNDKGFTRVGCGKDLNLPLKRLRGLEILILREVLLQYIPTAIMIRIGSFNLEVFNIY